MRTELDELLDHIVSLAEALGPPLLSLPRPDPSQEVISMARELLAAKVSRRERIARLATALAPTSVSTITEVLASSGDPAPAEIVHAAVSQLVKSGRIVRQADNSLVAAWSN